jgi:tetratricopeptide (TPR) repeat protein
VKTGRFGEAVTLAREALEASKVVGIAVPTASAALETARLWGVVGLGKAGLDDLEGARFAFEEAIALAPGHERLIWERHLVDLALAVGRRALIDVGAESGPERAGSGPERAGSGPERAESGPEHLAALRSAMDWLERGLDVAPEDAELRATLAAARDAMWPAHETIVKGLVQRQELAEARRMLTDVIADPECPPERQGAFRRLLGRTMGDEAARTTAEASTHLQGGRVEEAMAALVRAQSLIEAIPLDALAPRRRQELERRLWSGYVTLGANWVDAGAPDAALDPLFRAVSFTEIATERREEARGLLVRALGDIVQTRTAEIGRLIAAGDPSLAGIHSEKLWSLLTSAVGHGLPEELLAEAFGKVRAFLENMGVERP